MVQRLRIESENGQVRRMTLARRYGVSDSTARSIAARRTYTRLREPTRKQREKLFHEFATAEALDHLLWIEDALQRIQREHANLSLPKSWANPSEELKESITQLARVVKRLLNRFDKEVPDEKKTTTVTGKQLPPEIASKIEKLTQRPIDSADEGPLTNT